jgi:hypothetical protein
LVDAKRIDPKHKVKTSNSQNAQSTQKVLPHWKKHTVYRDLKIEAVGSAPDIRKGIIRAYRGKVYNVKFALKLAVLGMRSSG